MAAPVVRDVASSLKLNAKHFLLPLSYGAVLDGRCTLIGVLKNLLGDDLARTSGQALFTAGWLHLLLFFRLLLVASLRAESPDPMALAWH